MWPVPERNKQGEGEQIAATWVQGSSVLSGVSGLGSCPHILCSCCCSRTSPLSFRVEWQREVTDRGDTEKVSLWCVPPFLSEARSLLHWPY